MHSPITVGILSDTHLREPTEEFRQLAEVCFCDADIILHAGDLVDHRVLDVFEGKTVYAVHGNMCRSSACHRLPRTAVIPVGGFTIGLIHRTGFSYDFEALLLGEFDQMVDCIVYGHTHKPVCHERDGILYINPGRFLPTGRYGAPGSYALLTVAQQLTGRICQTPMLTDLGNRQP